MIRWSRLASIACGLLCIPLCALPVHAAGCTDIIARRVILASDAIDPNVFVWDQRMLLVKYASGYWHPNRTVLDHTLLEKPGTRAYVVACRPHQIRVRYSNVGRDAIGLKLLSGPNLGRYGWAIEDDVHPLR